MAHIKLDLQEVDWVHVLDLISQGRSRKRKLLNAVMNSKSCLILPDI
jgi:hypothetical protein